MDHVFYLLLRRLRAPIITIISVYAIAIVGFVLIPGEDDQGNVWRMDFFHAFYFVSFLGSTIGLGEVPYPFTAVQRIWTTLSIYATVISWLYSIGTIFALFQDHNFQRQLRRMRFIRRIKRLHQPYYLICGCGVTGSRLIRQLDTKNIRSVVIDSRQALIDSLETHELGHKTPSLCANAADPDILNIAGIQSDLCVGVLALTNDDHTNLAIAIDSKLVKPRRLVISGSQSKATTANLASFGTDLIIDPFATFADQLMLILREPYKHLIYNIIVNPHHRVWASPHQNTEGRWVVCNYGRFGKALEKKFRAHNIPHIFITPDPEGNDAPEGTVKGKGTEAKTLLKADIKNAVGVIAGTADDADNLSIIITAREINPALITVARQNKESNKPIFRAADVNLIMEPGRIVANEIYMKIRTPLLAEFFARVREHDEAWARKLLLRISSTIDDQELDAWTLDINAEQAPAFVDALKAELHIQLVTLQKDPRNRSEKLAAFPLMLKRKNVSHILPAPGLDLKIGDQILFCGQHHAQNHMRWTMANHNTLRYIQTGQEGPDGSLWRWLYERKERRAAENPSEEEP